MTGSVVRICQEIPRSRIPWTGRSTVQQDVRSATLISERTREAPWATVDRSSARRAPGRALVVELGAPTVRGDQGPSGGRLGRSGRLFVVELDDPPRRTPLQCISARIWSVP